MKLAFSNIEFLALATFMKFAPAGKRDEVAANRDVREAIGLDKFDFDDFQKRYNAMSQEEAHERPTALSFVMSKAELRKVKEVSGRAVEAGTLSGDMATALLYLEEQARDAVANFEEPKND